MTDKLMHIPYDYTKNYPSVDYNQWLKRLDTQLNQLTNQNLINVPKVVKVEKWKSYFKTLGTCVKNYHNVPSLPVENYIITKLLKVKGKYGG